MGNSVLSKFSYDKNEREDRLLKVEGEDRLLKVEVFKWSSEEYPEEYSVMYINYEGTSSCVLRVSANREKARFIINDFLCKDEAEISMTVEVNAVRDYSGKYTLGPRRIGCCHGIKIPTGDGKVPFEYGCDKRRALVYVDIERCHELNFWLELMRVDHSLYFLDEKEPLQFAVIFKFHRSKGLQVELEGPSHEGRLYIDKAEVGNPDDLPNDHSIVKSKFLFPSKDDVSNNVSAITGAINNVNARTLGKYNNSIFNNCTINDVGKK